MNRAAIIFDGDDTLWETMPAYALAKHTFFHEMELLGFNAQQVELQFEQTDLANVDKLGFSRERFANSMMETYHRFCRSYHIEKSVSVEQKLRALGYGVTASPPKVDPQAQRVLGRLRADYRLILATKGDQDVQLMKIEESGLGSFFDKIYIFDQKTERELKLIIEENGFSRRDSWSIGNSLRSDIKPALRLGLKAIWIPHYTWDYEEAEFEDSQDLFKVGSLEDCIEILARGRDSLLVSA
jgi:putative hydrolase of the HAD superfamily